MTDSTMQNLDTSEAFTEKPSTSVVDKLSQNKMESIIEAVVNQLVVKQEDLVIPKNQPARGLATTIIEGTVQIDPSGNGPQISSSGKMDAAEACWSSNEHCKVRMDSHSHYSCLVQSSLSPIGSLDYPDAPPTTPLVIDLERSRDSFARKLKGGLAKVFLPSTPPPTPLEGQGEPAGDTHGELLEHLIRSLPRNDSVGLDVVDRGHFDEDLEVFAEVLSRGIVNSALRTQS